MYKVNDTVLYGAEGVCVIEEIAVKDLGGISMEYYVLKPVNRETSTIYVPTKNQKLRDKMRRILSADEIRQLIRTMPALNTIWIEDDNERKRSYREIIQSGDRDQIIRLIKTLYLHQTEVKEMGRKVHVCDERFLKESEKILYNEFAHVLDIEPEQVLPYIFDQIESAEAEEIRQGAAS